ncbi:hypothetical protein HK102_007843 [Quaeritorhiza haematococci]|nr:hypothetical protein HK102_007843 [Quaeritorhiza haematococci]
MYASNVAKTSLQSNLQPEALPWFCAASTRKRTVSGSVPSAHRSSYDLASIIPPNCTANTNTAAGLIADVPAQSRLPHCFAAVMTAGEAHAQFLKAVLKDEDFVSRVLRQDI